MQQKTFFCYGMDNLRDIVGLFFFLKLFAANEYKIKMLDMHSCKWIAVTPLILV